MVHWKVNSGIISNFSYFTIIIFQANVHQAMKRKIGKTTEHNHNITIFRIKKPIIEEKK